MVMRSSGPSSYVLFDDDDDDDDQTKNRGDRKATTRGLFDHFLKSFDFVYRIIEVRISLQLSPPHHTLRKYNRHWDKFWSIDLAFPCVSTQIPFFFLF